MLQRLTNLSIFFILLLVLSIFGSAVAEANNSPNTVGPIPTQTVKIGATLTMNLNTYFNDVDGDVLTYTASSSDTSKATVSVSSNTLTVTPKAVGTATITLTGTDPGGLSATHDFSLTVADQDNNAPTTVGTIPKQTIKSGGAAVTIALGSYFNDADGDTLTYTATSDDTTKVTVSVSGADLTITPVAGGTVTVVVQATDPNGAFAKQDITVHVETPAAAPVAKGTIPNFDLLLGASNVTIEASLFFSDANGDELSYTAASSDTAVATLSVSYAAVSVNHVGAGTATITITATDPGGLSATQSFTVTVTANSPPTVVAIPAQTAPVGGSAITLNMDNYFSDVDEHPLVYTATSSNTAVATVSVSGSNVSITGKVLGTATITVTANDSFTTTTQSITVNVQNPPTAVGTIPDIEGAVNQAGTTIALSGYFSDPDGQTLTYSASVSDTYYVSVYINSSNGLEVTPLAAGNATITVTATNPDGLSATQSISVKLTESVFVGEADAIPGLSDEEQLLLGHLLTYDTIIFNELHNGSDDTTDWLELRNVSNVEIPIDNWQLRIQTGKDNVIIRFPAGTVIPTGEVLLITNTGMATADASISSVVIETFALPQADFALILRSPTAFGDLAGNYFQGQKERPETAPAFTVDTVWERVQATVSGYRAEAWAKSTHRNGLGSPGYQPSAVMGDLNNDNLVNILDLVLVASQFGTTGITAADLNGDMTVNIQDLVLVANAFRNVGAAPTPKQSAAATVNNWLQLAQQNESKIVKTSVPKGFSYDRGIEVLEQLARALTPNKTALLANYPNPFNPETWIPYQLSKAADVTVTIYASDGNVVRTLALGHQAAGIYKNRNQATYWDGTNETGESVASGVYFYTLTAGDFSATRKMIILK